MQESVLNQFNNADLLELDPLVARGYRPHKQLSVGLLMKYSAFHPGSKAPRASRSPRKPC